MKNTKYIIATVAVLGLLGIFALPYIEGIKLWALRSEGSVSSQIYIVLFGFLGALVVSGVGMLRGALTRGLGIASLILFLLTLATGAVRDGFKDGTASGAKILLLAALAGLVMSVAAVVKPERRAA